MWAYVGSYCLSWNFLKINSPLYHRETFLHFGGAELNSVTKNLMEASMDNILLEDFVSQRVLPDQTGGTVVHDSADVPCFENVIEPE
jgi:hypothetical protein